MEKLKEIQEHYNKILNFDYDSLDDIILSIKDDLKYIASKEKDNGKYNFIFKDSSDKEYISDFMQFIINTISEETNEKIEILELLKNKPKETLKNNDHIALQRYLFLEDKTSKQKKNIDDIIFNSEDYKKLTEEEIDIFYIQYKALFTILTFLSIEMIYLYIDNSEILKNLFSIDNVIYQTFYKDEERKPVNIDEAVAFIKIYDFALEENRKTDFKYLIFNYVLSYRYFLFNAFLYIYNEETPPDYFNDTSKEILSRIKEHQKRPTPNKKNDKVISYQDRDIIIYNDNIDYLILEYFNFLKTDQNIKDFFTLFIDLFTYTKKKADKTIEAFLNKKNKKENKITLITETLTPKDNNLNFLTYKDDYILTDKLSQEYNINNNKIRRLLKDNKDIINTYKNYKKGESIQNKIDKFKKDNQDFNIKDDKQIIQYLQEKGEETNLFIYLEYKNIKQQGFTFTDMKDRTIKKSFLNYNNENLINTLDLADSEIMKDYGFNMQRLKKIIDSLVLNYFRHNNPNTIFNKVLSFTPQAYNDKIGRTKRTTETAEELEQTLHLLQTQPLKINNKGYIKNGNIFKTTEKNINKSNLDETKKIEIINLTKEKILTYSIIESYEIEKDPTSNKITFYVSLSRTYINFIYLVYLNNFFQIDRTETIKNIDNKPNDLTPLRATAIKDYLIKQMKIDTSKRITLKNNNYVLYEEDYLIKDLIKILEDNNLINLNNLKKMGYKDTYYTPIIKTIKHLKDNNIINYRPSIDNIITGKATKEKQLYFENFEITIELLNEKNI